MWDSGIRTAPADLLTRAQKAISTQRRQQELLSLDVLAVFYNQRRRHSSAGRMSPADFERRTTQAA
jgi:transposase InsO family protein